MQKINLFIGTSGWSYKHWSGIFYPEDLKPAKYLEFYTTKFICVELNASFYHLPFKKTVTGWMNRTPDNFRFCLKLSRFITHQMQLVKIEGAMERFFDVFEELKAKLGPVLVQLPPGLSYDEPRMRSFLELVKDKYNRFRFAFEIRNKSWINDNFFDLLKNYESAFVISDSGDRYPYYEAVTSDFVYLRLHGREQLYASDYSDADLRQYSEMIKAWLNTNKEVWVFFNNDYHGYAVKNAETLKNFIDLN